MFEKKFTYWSTFGSLKSTPPRNIIFLGIPQFLIVFLFGRQIGKYW